MYHSDVKTKQWEYWETLQIDNMLVNHLKRIVHIYKWCYQGKHCGLSKYFCLWQALVHAHAISLALIWSPVSDRERKRDGSPQRPKQMVSSGHSNSSGQSCLWGAEHQDRKPLACPEASWPLEHVPEEHWIAQCSFKALEIYWRSQLCFLCWMLVWISLEN